MLRWGRARKGWEALTEGVGPWASRGDREVGQPREGRWWGACLPREKGERSSMRGGLPPADRPAPPLLPTRPSLSSYPEVPSLQACLALSWPKVGKAPCKPLSLAAGPWEYLLCSPGPCPAHTDPQCPARRVARIPQTGTADKLHLSARVTLTPNPF